MKADDASRRGLRRCGTDYGDAATRIDDVATRTDDAATSGL